MTMQEALHKRIPRIRKEKWTNPNAYLRLPLMRDGLHGPWAELYDDWIQENVIHIQPGSQRILTISDDTDWVEYKGPVSPHEQDKENFAKVYLEE